MFSLIVLLHNRTSIKIQLAISPDFVLGEL